MELILIINQIFQGRINISPLNNFENEIGVSVDSAAGKDAKNIYQHNNNTIYFFQHLISENGIEIYTPVQCKEKIEANAVFDFNNLNVKIRNENTLIAQIKIKKWNELRKNQKIKLKSEFIESKQ